MRLDQEPEPGIRRIGGGASGARGLLGTVLAVATAVLLLAFGFMFMLLLLAALAVAGALGYAWLWWKTRALRRQMRQHAERMQEGRDVASADGDIIEGEIVHKEQESQK